MLPSLTVQGLDDLADDFLQLSGALEGKVARSAVMAGARVGRDAIRSTAPVRSRNLQRSVIAKPARGKGADGEVSAGVMFAKPKNGRPAFYWKFLELGTLHQRSHPFVRPAWDGSLPRIEQATIDRLADGIDNARNR
ncbi:HK97-gp10 family putative phage morphogenesis protein [Pseudomonas sp. NPDC086581]|uniref:HK97-gp10 family putative phage morphogenesis protein n=1 Tax=Pseudomonas sp. NPDC086581 TaxID=3364432 RepID=UPI0038290072